MNKSQIDRFLDKVMFEPNSGCWLWTAAVNDYGYGSFRLGKAGDGMEGAHRVSYRLFNGEYPSDKHVLHKCDVRACVNPRHLFLGTNADNMADKIAKGRQVRGEMCNYAKLTEAQVIQIKSLSGKKPQREVADQFGVTRSLVGSIQRGECWRHI